MKNLKNLLDQPLFPSLRLSRAFMVTALCLGGTGFAHAAAPSDPSPASRIFGGRAVDTCEWPSTIGFGSCSGTLIHPNVVLYAAHCGRQSKIILGENYRSGAAKKIPVKFCKTNPKFFGIKKGTDFAFCYLDKPITDVPIAPIAYGCELEQIKPGAEIWLVGFGKVDNGSSGTKYKVKTKVNHLLVKGAEVNVGGNGKATCYGDSGGPAFIQLSDGSWRTFGITSYGTSSSCGYPSGMTMANVAVPWIHQELKKAGITDVDITPCYDDDGTWAPNEHCSKFPLELGTGFGTWKQSCGEKAKLSGASTICATGDDKQAPTVDFVGIDDGDRFEENDDIEIKAKAKDDSGRPVKVTLVYDGEKQEARLKPPYAWTVKASKTGSLTLYLLAEDASGNEAKSDKIKIRVVEDEGDDSEDSSEAPGDKDNKDSKDGSNEDDKDSSPEDSSKSDDDDDTSPSEDDSEENDDNEDEGSTNKDPAGVQPAPPAKPRPGCSLAEPSSPPLWALGLGFLGLLISRRGRKAL